MGIVWVLEEAAPVGQTTLTEQLVGSFAVRRHTTPTQLVGALSMAYGRAAPALVVLAGASGDTVPGQLDPGCPIVRYEVGHAQAQLVPVGEGPAIPLEVGNPERLVAAVASLMVEPASILRYGNLALDCEALTLSVAPDGEREALSVKEARLLKVFMQQPRVCLTRAQIKASVWGSIHVSPRTIDSQISRLRKRLAWAGITIDNVYGDGYVFG